MNLSVPQYLYCFLITLFSSSFATAQITSNFNTNDEGWTAFDANAGASNTPVYNSTGGNPGGAISFTTSSPSVNFYWIAPAKFNGNFSTSYNQTLTFDLKQSLAGTDNTVGDVMIISSAGTLFYQLPAKPSTSSWSSYSVPLNEASWKAGCPTCAVATLGQMKEALYGITKLQIRLKYFSGNTGPYTAQLDNVVLNVPALASPPTITSFTPSSALAGSSVTITGTNFNNTSSQNNVYFNGVKAAVTSATATQLVVTVPTSAAYGAITVTNLSTGLSGRSKLSFNPLFDNNKDYGGQIISGSMARGYNTLLPMSNSFNTFGGIQKGDIDGDGWIDLLVTETGTQKIFVYRNLGTGGAVSTSSFAAPVALPSISGIPGGGPNLGEIIVADFDSDGKPDVAAGTAGNTSGDFALFRNTSTAGTISFASPLFFPIAYYSSGPMAAGDLDGDGRLDLITTTGTSPGNLWICQNLSTPGSIDFAYGGPVSATPISGYSAVLIGDLNGDNKPEIIASGYNSSAFYVYQNTSSPGSISMNAPFSYTLPAISNARSAIGDLNGDSKLDLIWSGYGTTTVYVLQNIYTGGVFDATSFGAVISLPGKVSNPAGVGIGDINSDGKPDIVATGYYDVGIFQNLMTSGTISASSFLPGVICQGSAGGQAIVGLGPVIADLDGDNKPEIAMVYSNSSVTAGEKGLYIFHNESYPVPTISGISPTSASSGNIVSISGSLMKTGNATPILRMNNTLSTVSSPSNTSVSALIPAGIVSGKFTVTEHGLTGFSKPFNVLFSTNRTINTSSFGPSVDFTLGGNPRDALIIADWDDDGKNDVGVIDNFSTAKIFQNIQTAGQPITASSITLLGTTYTGGYDMAAFDIDGDGKIDLNNGYGLLQNNSTPGTISFLSGPNGIYTYAGGFTAKAISDFNKDGKADMAVTNGGASVQIYENLSSRGVFENNSNLSTFNVTPTTLAKPGGGGGVVTADFDGDGYDDIISTNQSTSNISTFLNAAQYGPITSTSFSSASNFSTSGSQPIDITTNDFDGDGKPDIAVAYYNSAFVSVYRNTSTLGAISFSSPLDMTSLNKGYKITSQDLDGDGLAEIIVIHQPNPGPGSFSIFQNKSTSGATSFATVVNYPISRNPQAVAVADINLDQKPDILIVANAGTPANALMIFENKITTGPVITISPQPLDAIVCNSSTATFTTGGSGTTNITYQWQFATTSAGPFTDIVDGGGYSGATTNTLSVNTTGTFGAGRYRCKIGGDLATPVVTTDEGLFINPVPNAPTTTGATKCNAASLILNASGGSNGQYRWYTVQTGGSALPGEVNSTYTTPVITTTTTYYASINNGSCESTRTAVTATVAPLAKPQLSFTPAASGNTIDLCTGQTQTIAAPSGLKTYTWSNGAASPQIVVTQTGIYSVVVTDVSGCVSPPSDAITVTIHPYPQATISLDNTNLIVSPADSYQWYSSNQAIPGATAQTLEISFLEFGSYAVDVTTNGCMTHSSDFIYLVTAAEKPAIGITIYPNPVSNELHVEVSPSYTLQLTDLMGREVYAPVSETSSGKLVSTSHLQTGNYFLILQSATTKRYFKISKQ